MPSDERRNLPDLVEGLAATKIPASGLLAGRVGEHDVVLVRGASRLFAIGAKCTHRGGPLAEGIVVGDTVRCPWHHACFHAATGEALAAPAFEPVPCWTVEEHNGTVVVRDKTLPEPPRPAQSRSGEPVVIVGAGAAGYAAAEALVRLNYPGPVTLLGHEPAPPYDRTELSKNYLEGLTDDDTLPLRGADLGQHGVALHLGATVTRIEPDARQVQLSDGTVLPFAKLVLATGAEPRRLTVPGGELGHVLVLRSVEDARMLIDQAAQAFKVVVVGSGFIAMEAAACLRARGLDVTVVGPDQHPFAKILGPDLSATMMALHRKKGTAFRLGRAVTRIEPDHVVLDDGSTLAADLVLVGIGVAPRTALADHAGLHADGGLIVDAQLRTSHPDIYAVGDIARWPDPHSGESIRVEHWAVAQRQGQVAALNIAGYPRPFDAVPFFWTKQFDFSVRVVGHATGWDEAVLDGDPEQRDAVVSFRKAGREVAVATVERDRDNLQAELRMERRLGQTSAALPSGRED